VGPLQALSCWLVKPRAFHNSDAEIVLELAAKFAATLFLRLDHAPSVVQYGLLDKPETTVGTIPRYHHRVCA